MVYFIVHISTSIFEIIDAEVGKFSRFFEILISKIPKSGLKNPLVGIQISRTQSDILNPSKKMKLGEMVHLTINGKHQQKLKK